MEWLFGGLGYWLGVFKYLRGGFFGGFTDFRASKKLGARGDFLEVEYLKASKRHYTLL